MTSPKRKNEKRKTSNKKNNSNNNAKTGSGDVPLAVELRAERGGLQGHVIYAAASRVGSGLRLSSWAMSSGICL